ncbi:hypothetical protein H0B56_21500 [Haloechinothrix sp. YIM 98757]|uniref:Uncharacterized protein n=1 Tax=Haloechinothrix aidingensis TaxID=2752311 RepID=A0A838AFQ8_9PSEU|nr:hypothetical protein [Haloechinothrix aidingensis]MBA0128129.1 hypothetical protein [Haloechinothrix aidingensis]
MDWRDRTSVKGGPLVHGLARAGWGAGAVVGAAVVPGAVVLGGALGGTGIGAALLVLAVLLVAGAVPGAALGALAQQGARSWLCAPTEQEQRSARARSAHAERLDASDLDDSSRWGRHYQACAASVHAFHELVRTVPAGRSRDWLADIGERLDGELAEALRLARLGQQLDSGVSQHEEQAATPERIVERLRAAEADFAATVERASAIALESTGDSDFQHLHAELDMLAEQAPRLRLPGGHE